MALPQGTWNHRKSQLYQYLNFKKSAKTTYMYVGMHFHQKSVPYKYTCTVNYSAHSFCLLQASPVRVLNCITCSSSLVVSERTFLVRGFLPALNSSRKANMWRTEQTTKPMKPFLCQAEGEGKRKLTTLLLSTLHLQCSGALHLTTNSQGFSSAKIY